MSAIDLVKLASAAEGSGIVEPVTDGDCYDIHDLDKVCRRR